MESKEKYGVEKFEEWIENRVDEGVFPSREEAYRVLAYYAWSTYEWAKQFWYRVFLKEGVTPMTVEKIYELEGDIVDDDKTKEYREEFKKKVEEEYIKAVKQANDGDVDEEIVGGISAELIGHLGGDEE